MKVEGGVAVVEQNVQPVDWQGHLMATRKKRLQNNHVTVRRSG